MYNIYITVLWSTYTTFYSCIASDKRLYGPEERGGGVLFEALTRYVCEIWMPIKATKSKFFYFLYKGHVQGHKVIDLDVIWEAYEVPIPYINKYNKFTSYG